jgi:hypothetical protein
MLGDILLFVLRLAFIVVFWSAIWGLIKPRSQLLRIARALLLVVGLLGILAVLRMTGQ